MDIRKIYEYALQREHEGLRFFSENANRAQHSSVMSVFQQLACEEEAHIAFIERLLAKLAQGEPVTADTVATEIGAKDGWFTKRAESEMVEQTVAESMVPDLSVLRMAYLIEQDLAEFYRHAASQCEGEAREALELLSMWEQEHERLFKSLHDSAFKVYMQMPWGG